MPPNTTTTFPGSRTGLHPNLRVGLLSVRSLPHFLFFCEKHVLRSSKQRLPPSAASSLPLPRPPFRCHPARLSPPPAVRVIVWHWDLCRQIDILLVGFWLLAARSNGSCDFNFTQTAVLSRKGTVCVRLWIPSAARLLQGLTFVTHCPKATGSDYIHHIPDWRHPQQPHRLPCRLSGASPPPQNPLEEWTKEIDKGKITA